MKVIKNKIIGRRHIIKGGVLENIRFEGCSFTDGLRISTGIRKPADTFIVRNCQFVQCEFHDTGLSVGQATIENVLIDNCTTVGKTGLTFSHTLLKHVVIKGRLDALNIFMPYIKPDFFATDNIPEHYLHFTKLYHRPGEITGYYEYNHSLYLHLDEIHALRDAVFLHYDKVDWALDISGAEIGSWQVKGKFPGSKVIFNPDIHALVDKETLAEGKWKTVLPDTEAYIARCLNNAHKYECEGAILVPGDSSENMHSNDAAHILALREAGIAHPSLAEDDSPEL